MSTLNLKAISICAGGNHATIQVSLNSVVRTNIGVTPDEIAQAPSDDELKTAVDVLLRAYSVGRTKAQVKTALIAGIDIAL